MSLKRTRADITEKQIAVRAYERWMGRGAPVSDGVEDWVAAREELEAELGKPASKTVTRKTPAKAPAKTPGKAPGKTKAAPSPASIH